jgi:hypothetical protein
LGTTSASSGAAPLSSPPSADAIRKEAARRRDEVARKRPPQRAGVKGAGEDSSGSEMDPPPPVLPGFRGVGPSLVVGRSPQGRPFNDGGGRCSPGRWPPSRRRFPGDRGGPLREWILAEAARLEAASPGWRAALIEKLRRGELLHSPFPEASTKTARNLLGSLLRSHGFAPDDVPGDIAQPVKVPLRGASLLYRGGPDGGAFAEYAGGVRVGVGHRLPGPGPCSRGSGAGAWRSSGRRRASWTSRTWGSP